MLTLKTFQQVLYLKMNKQQINKQLHAVFFKTRFYSVPFPSL